MASKKQHEAFNKRVVKAITELGAKPTNLDSDTFRSFGIETKAGELHISLHTPMTSPVFSIFTRYIDHRKAKEVLEPLGLDKDLNRYSGKWNFHSLDEQKCMETFLNSLKKVLVHEKAIS